jgi:hypothetical protein
MSNAINTMAIANALTFPFQPINTLPISAQVRDCELFHFQ